MMISVTDSYKLHQWWSLHSTMSACHRTLQVVQDHYSLNTGSTLLKTLHFVKHGQCSCSQINWNTRGQRNYSRVKMSSTCLLSFATLLSRVWRRQHKNAYIDGSIQHRIGHQGWLDQWIAQKQCTQSDDDWNKEIVSKFSCHRLCSKFTSLCIHWVKEKSQ